MSKRIHFISIGGAVMHNLALCLQELGHRVSGSDDEIFEPSKGRLKAAGLLPDKIGWEADRISQDLDFIILGMHARSDNPELIKARELEIPVYSFPEYIYEHAKDKTRLVIAGSHGKTTTTAMVMHVLKEAGKDFDYLVGSLIDGYKTMVRLSDAPLIVIEGDEYLNSVLDPRPKFLFYKPQLTQITGIAWDHINVFPTWEAYVKQFELYLQTLQPETPVAYYSKDETLTDLMHEHPELQALPYAAPEFRVEKGRTIVVHEGNEYPMKFFGKHNLENMSGALTLLEKLGIDRKEGLNHMQSFSGTARRLEVVLEDKDRIIIRDFAHSPSKLKASVQAVKELHPDRKLFAIFELHTFSSLTRDFLEEYHRCLEDADIAIVYFNPEVLKHKRLPELDPEEVAEAFGGQVRVYTDSDMLAEFIQVVPQKNTSLLLMSSGDFNGIQLNFSL